MRREQFFSTSQLSPNPDDCVVLLLPKTSNAFGNLAERRRDFLGHCLVGEWRRELRRELRRDEISGRPLHVVYFHYARLLFKEGRH
jgi:hypothetical protein